MNNIFTNKRKLINFVELAIIAASFAVVGCTSFSESSYSKMNRNSSTQFLPLTHDDGGYPLTQSGELAIDP